ncbi:MAG: zinc ABC transporter substrate-binding protein [Roseicyclus sp.]|nr:zinc ABC transporter substrate-binding protein [Roseicyclus sp.]
MKRAFATLALTATLLPATAQANEPVSIEPVSIVATTGMIADAARQIGGELVQVQALMGAGVDPHSYRQTRSDIVATARADLVLWHGLYLESQMEGFLLELAETNTVVPVAESLSRDLLLGSEAYPDLFDPHVWMDPAIWADVVQRIEGVLSEAMPTSADVFAANAASLQTEIDGLITYSHEVLSSVPDGSRVLLTAHDAFRYFGAAYGIEVIGIQGMSTESEAGLQRMGALVDMLVARNIHAVFVESSVSDRNIRALIEGAAARGHEVVIGGELYSDAMGPDGTYEGTWIGMIDHNVTTIARALGGDVPDGGMQGLLQ